MSIATPETAPVPARRGVAAAAAAAAVLPLVPDDDGRPVLRLLPAPCSEPPYDDELPTVRVLPAAADAAPARWRPPAHLPPLRLVPELGAAPESDDDDDDTPRRTPLAQLPDARPFARALVQRLLEVLAGLRPLSQLQRDTTFELFTELEETLAGRARPAGPRPTHRDVRSVHVQARPDGVAEVCATVRQGGRTGALALRLEGVDGAWRCSALLGL